MLVRGEAVMRGLGDPGTPRLTFQPAWGGSYTGLAVRLDRVCPRRTDRGHDPYQPSFALLQGIVGNLASGKSALVHRYLTGTYVQEESPEGTRGGRAPASVCGAFAVAHGYTSQP